jgi:hypothetical protein
MQVTRGHSYAPAATAVHHTEVRHSYALLCSTPGLVLQCVSLGVKCRAQDPEHPAFSAAGFL